MDDTSILHALPKYNNKLSNNVLLNSGSLTNNGSYIVSSLNAVLCLYRVRLPLFAAYTSIQYIYIFIFIII